MSIVTIPPKTASADLTSVLDYPQVDELESLLPALALPSQDSDEQPATELPEALQLMYSQLLPPPPPPPQQLQVGQTLASLQLPAGKGQPVLDASALGLALAKAQSRLPGSVIAQGSRQVPDFQPAVLHKLQRTAASAMPTGQPVAPQSLAMTHSVISALSLQTLPAGLSTLTVVASSDGLVAGVPTADIASGSATIAMRIPGELERSAQAGKSTASEVSEPATDRVVLLPGSEIKAQSLAGRAGPTATPPPPQAQSQTHSPALMVPAHAASTAPAAYLQVPFNNGALVGHITINKATPDHSQFLPSQLQMTASNQELNSHLREQLTQVDKPWHLRQESGDGGQSKHSRDSHQEDEDAQLPKGKPDSKAQLA